MKKSQYRVLGVMSGTSLDGIDMAVVNFRREVSWEFSIETAATVPYPEEWQDRLGEAVFEEMQQLEQLDEAYTTFLAGVILEFLRTHEVGQLDAICSHGHTVKHEPHMGLTLQIGNLPRLAQLLQQTVVCDFRVQDVALGGQGAPLVPVGDELLFAEFAYCLNLGGFANISTKAHGRRIAYDICAVNTVLNHLAQKAGHPYDKDGALAASGKLDEALWQQLQALDFYRQTPPKSLGIEWVHQHIFPLLESVEVTSALHTYSLHAATQIARCFDEDPDSWVLATGGGAFNSFLMDQLQARTRCRIEIPAPELVNFKEALIFGFLGVLKLRGENNVLKEVTGASKDHSSGVVFKIKN